MIEVSEAFAAEIEAGQVPAISYLVTYLPDGATTDTTTTIKVDKDLKSLSRTKSIYDPSGFLSGSAVPIDSISTEFVKNSESGSMWNFLTTHGVTKAYRTLVAERYIVPPATTPSTWLYDNEQFRLSVDTFDETCKATGQSWQFDTLKNITFSVGGTSSLIVDGESVLPKTTFPMTLYDLLLYIFGKTRTETGIRYLHNVAALKNKDFTINENPFSDKNITCLDALKEVLGLMGSYAYLYRDGYQGNQQHIRFGSVINYSTDNAFEVKNIKSIKTSFAPWLMKAKILSSDGDYWYEQIIETDEELRLYTITSSIPKSTSDCRTLVEGLEASYNTRFFDFEIEAAYDPRIEPGDVITADYFPDDFHRFYSVVTSITTTQQGLMKLSCHG